MVEVDALGRSSRPIDRERSIGHLAMLAGSYRELGSEVLIVTATLEDGDHRSSVVETIGADELLLVRLEADPETLRDRILSREPPEWEGLPELLNASRSLTASMPDLGDVDLVLSTEGEQPGTVAELLEAAVRDRLTPGGR